MVREWVDSLRSALEREFADRPRVVTLATVGRDGAARARSVVVRRIKDDGVHLFVSDARSEKNKELRIRMEAEVVYWLASQRVQFRLRGPAVPKRSIGARDVWKELSDATRATFFWPAPGEPRVDAAEEFPAGVGRDVEPPESYELIRFMPMEVERLNLNPHPHDRRRWVMTEQGWQEAWLNP
jgi:pyridoxamine 5'-phosphate oxidase